MKRNGAADAERLIRACALHFRWTDRQTCVPLVMSLIPHRHHPVNNISVTLTKRHTLLLYYNPTKYGQPVGSTPQISQPDIGHDLQRGTFARRWHNTERFRIPSEPQLYIYIYI